MALMRRYFVFAARTPVLHNGSAILESASMGSTWPQPCALVPHMPLVFIGRQTA